MAGVNRSRRAAVLASAARRCNQAARLGHGARGGAGLPLRATGTLGVWKAILASDAAGSRRGSSGADVWVGQRCNAVCGMDWNGPIGAVNWAGAGSARDGIQ